MFGVFDGHGSVGDLCSHFCAQNVSSDRNKENTHHIALIQDLNLSTC